MKRPLRMLFACTVLMAGCSDSTPGFWTHEESGVRIRLPAGFTVGTPNGIEAVGRWSGTAGEVSPNITVIVIPIVGEPGLDALHDQNKAALESMDEIEIRLLEKTSISGTEVVHCEFYGLLPGVKRRLYYEGILYPLSTERQVVVTATCTKEQRTELGDELALALKGMTIPPQN
jgi:hypothetical protein